MTEHKRPKIVFLGTPDFATYILKTIVEHGHDVATVVTMPDKPAGRGHKLQPSSVKSYAIEQGLPVLQPEKLKDPTFLDTLKAIEADLFIVVAFRMLPKEVWAMPPKGTFNLHASLLPKYRGAAPIQHAILNGEMVTGVTTFLLDEEIDTGNILMYDEVEICDTDDAGTLHDKLMISGGELVLRTIDLIASHDIVPTVTQAEKIEAGRELPFAPKIFKEDRILHFSTSTAQEILLRVRAMSPYPTAISQWQMQDGSMIEVKVFETKPYTGSQDIPPGIVRKYENRLLVGTQDGIVELQSIQLPSKRRVQVSDFINGFEVEEISRIL